MTQSIRDAAQALLDAMHAVHEHGRRHDDLIAEGLAVMALRAALSAPQPTAQLDERLYCECKTDEERAEFFASGRAYETGIVAASVAMDVARAFFAKSLVGEITYPAHMRKEGAV